MSRFDYVKYSPVTQSLQEDFKEKFMELEADVEYAVCSPRAKALVLTKLEEAYMWIGKGLRDDQIARDKTAQPQEERKNG